MNLKKILTIIVLSGSIITTSISSTVGATVGRQNQEQERLKHEVPQLYSIDEEIEEEPFSDEEKAMIEENYRISLEQRSKIEEELSNELANILNDDSLKTKVVSIEKEDKIDSMLAMITTLENTELSESIKEQIKSYINTYGPYTDNITILNYIEELNGNNINEYASYNANAAANYAYTWWETYNSSSYPDLSFIGGDCANFVSQCLKAGGKTTDNKWYMTKKNSTYTKPTSISQFNHSWNVSNPSPWISAKEFDSYWSNKVSYHGSYNASFVYENPKTIYDASYYIGDAVQILKKNNWWYDAIHTMIITKYEKSRSDYRLTYHSSNTKDKLLNSIAASYNSDGYRIKFFCM